METAEATFVAMFMERLNALEEKNVALEQQFGRTVRAAEVPNVGNEELSSAEGQADDL